MLIPVVRYHIIIARTANTTNNSDDDDNDNDNDNDDDNDNDKSTATTSQRQRRQHHRNSRRALTKNVPAHFYESTVRDPPTGQQMGVVIVEQPLRDRRRVPARPEHRPSGRGGDAVRDVDRPEPSAAPLQVDEADLHFGRGVGAAADGVAAAAGIDRRRTARRRRFEEDVGRLRVAVDDCLILRICPPSCSTSGASSSSSSICGGRLGLKGGTNLELD